MFSLPDPSQCSWEEPASLWKNDNNRCCENSVSTLIIISPPAPPFAQKTGLVCDWGSPKKLNSSSSPSPNILHRIFLNFTIDYNGNSTSLISLVDSGADDNFIDEALVQKLQIETEPVETPRSVRVLDGQIDWSKASITTWSFFCYSHCLRSVQFPGFNPKSPPLDQPDLTGVPAEYHDHAEVFSKAKTLFLHHTAHVTVPYGKFVFI